MKDFGPNKKGAPSKRATGGHAGIIGSFIRTTSKAPGGNTELSLSEEYQVEFEAVPRWVHGELKSRLEELGAEDPRCWRPVGRTGIGRAFVAERSGKRLCLEGPLITGTTIVVLNQAMTNAPVDVKRQKGGLN